MKNQKKQGVISASWHYRWEKTQEILQERSASGESPGVYDDIFCGEDYLDLVDDRVIGKYDTVLMLSMDGVQLYESKKSDCWIYIWIIADLALDKCYKIRNHWGQIGTYPAITL